MKRLLIVALAVSLGVGCSQGPNGAPAAEPSDCGLLDVDPAADASQVPEPLLLGDEVEVATTQIQQGRLLAALNVRLSVDESFAAYRRALGRADLEILQEDNEGFEAELYVGAGKELGSVVIRRSICDDAVVVYLNLPAEPSAR